MPFEFTSTAIPGVVVVTPRIFPDDRGFFLETYKASEFRRGGITDAFVQDNHSWSTHGALRGIHFQKAPHAQGKLVSVITGRVWDVAVDLRPDSATFKQWVSAELDAGTGTMLYIPPGFGHGFVVLSDNAHFVYKCTAEYAPRADGGIRWNDPELAILWPVAEPVVSAKDAGLPLLGELVAGGAL